MKIIKTKNDIENAREDDVLFKREDYGIDFPIVIWGEINTIKGFECLSIHYNDNDYYYSLNENITIHNEWIGDSKEKIDTAINLIGKDNIFRVIQEKYNQCIKDDIDFFGNSKFIEAGKQDIISSIEEFNMELSSNM